MTVLKARFWRAGRGWNRAPCLRLSKLLALCLLPLLLTGCWSYRSLSEMSIVMGVAVDRDEGGGYRIAVEIIDLTKPLRDEAPGSKIVYAQGQTLFEAVRNAKRRLYNRLYFGNIQILLIGEEAARGGDMLEMLDWFLRDGESRETITIIVAKGSAIDMLAQEGIDQTIVSAEVDHIVTNDHKITSSTAYVELYQAYAMLMRPGIELTLSALHTATNGDKQVIESDGTAAFRDGTLVGYLTPEESMAFLIATSQCQGGILALSPQDGGFPNTSLEIQNSDADISFEHSGDSLTCRIETETNVFLAETASEIDVLDRDAMTALGERAARKLEESILSVVGRVQSEWKSDIFGLGLTLYRHDAALWKKIGEDWENIFPTLSVEVSCEINIVNSAFIKTRGADKR